MWRSTLMCQSGDHSCVTRALLCQLRTTTFHLGLSFAFDYSFLCVCDHIVFVWFLSIAIFILLLLVSHYSSHLSLFHCFFSASCGHLYLLQRLLFIVHVNRISIRMLSFWMTRRFFECIIYLRQQVQNVYYSSTFSSIVRWMQNIIYIISKFYFKYKF